jgi:hypothetical protein
MIKNIIFDFGNVFIEWNPRNIFCKVYAEEEAEHVLQNVYSDEWNNNLDIGAGLQDVLSGHLIGGSKTMADGLVTYDFSAVRYFWIGAAAVSFLLCATLWKAKNKT